MQTHSRIYDFCSDAQLTLLNIVVVDVFMSLQMQISLPFPGCCHDIAKVF